MLICALLYIAQNSSIIFHKEGTNLPLVNCWILYRVFWVYWVAPRICVFWEHFVENWRLLTRRSPNVIKALSFDFIYLVIYWEGFSNFEQKPRLTHAVIDVCNLKPCLKQLQTSIRMGHSYIRDAFSRIYRLGHPKLQQFVWYLNLNFKYYN